MARVQRGTFAVTPRFPASPPEIAPATDPPLIPYAAVIARIRTGRPEDSIPAVARDNGVPYAAVLDLVHAHEAWTGERLPRLGYWARRQRTRSGRATTPVATPGRRHTGRRPGCSEAELERLVDAYRDHPQTPLREILAGYRISLTRFYDAVRRREQASGESLRRWPPPPHHGAGPA
jgi:hypothetical protein